MNKILMDVMEQTTHNLKNRNKKLIKLLSKLRKIGLVIRMYQQGAESDSCMQRIVNIFTED